VLPPSLLLSLSLFLNLSLYLKPYLYLPLRGAGAWKQDQETRFRLPAACDPIPSRCRCRWR
jgi:hypothetical protein